MRMIFMGSALLACPSLTRLLQLPGHTVAAVVTQPDRPRGRHLHVAACPAKAMATAAGVRVLTPANAADPAFVAALRELRPDLIAVVAYGHILRPAVLVIPPLGCVNVHASLLPRYRGAAPIQWAVAHGETMTGVTTFYLDEGMDTGDTIFRREVSIAPDDTAGTLQEKLSLAGADLLVRTVEAIEAGTAPREPQDSARATLARKLRKEDGLVDWRRPARELAARVRGFNPWPACHAPVPGRDGRPAVLRLLRAAVEPGQGTPGEVLSAAGAGPLVATGDGALRLLDVQPEGRGVMSGEAYQRGRGLQPGIILASPAG